MMTGIRILCGAAATCAALSARAAEDFASYVDPFTGTAGTGHTHPGACVPFGMVQAGPDTGCNDWAYCSGYQYRDKSVLGYSQTHLSGTGCPDYGDVQVLPFTGDLGAMPMRRTIDKASERAEPGFYTVVQPDDSLRVEIAAAKRAAIYRLTRSEAGEVKVLVNLPFGIGDHVYETDTRKVNVRTDGAKAEVDAGARTLCGEHFRTGWISRRKVAYAIAFDRAWRTLARVPGTLGTPDEAPRYVATFDVAAGEPLLMKVALSMTGADGATRNLAAELPGWDFDGVRAAARARWNELFARATCEGTDDQKRNWYTALYHLYGQPTDYADADGRFAAADGTVFDSPDGTYFTTLSLWDTFRAAQPWYALATPEIVEPIVNSLLSHYRTFGRLPVMSYGGKNVDCMVGNHAVPVIADAWLKGFRGFDAALAFEAVTNTLTLAHPGKPKENWDLYDKYGYFPCDVIKGESVSRTLECAYDDACAARFASALGKSDAAAFFATRAGYWKNVIDPSVGFARGKTTQGMWRTPFDPYAFGHGADVDNDFTEGNAFQYTWHVMQDVPGLVAAMGGRETFAKRLDALFAAPNKVAGEGLVLDISGMIGQYVHGNEPSHHVIYFYPQVGRYATAAERVREVFDTQYHVGPEGLCGNDDCGQMSAWYLFSAMGFYPFDPCGGEYVIGAPQLPRMTLRLAGGKAFTVIAKNLSGENKYVKSVALNGRLIANWKIRHADIVKGGTLVFEMSAQKTPSECPPPRNARVVQDAPGYNAWPMVQALGTNLVCVYSRDSRLPADGHYIDKGSRDSYARVSSDGGRTWSAERVVAADPDVGEVNEGIGLDSTGAVLAWVRCWWETPERRRHELWRSTDGLSFEKVATPKLDPLPMQITNPVAVPGLGLVSPWFAGGYAGEGNSWGLLVSQDDGRTWEQRTVEKGLPVRDWVTEPSLVSLGDGKLLIVGRCEQGLGPQFQVTSADGGRTWKKARTNIDDVHESTPSLVYDARTGLVANYYYQRVARQLKRRVVRAADIFDNPTGWPEPEVLAEGFEPREYDAGNVSATRLPGGSDVCAWYTGTPSQSSVVVTSVPTPEATVSATSPDGRTEIRVRVGKELTWQIVRDGRPLLDAASRLGLSFAGETAEMSGFSLVSSRAARVRDAFETRLYRRGKVDLAANETAFEVRAADGRRLGLVLRAYDDAVAFRYAIPGEDEYAIARERTTWEFPGDPEAWMAFFPAEDDGRVFGRWSGSEEGMFYKAKVNMIPKQGVIGVPAIVGCGETRLAICEADLADWAALWFCTDNPWGRRRQTATLFARSPERPGEKGVVVRGKARRVSPWRVMILSETDAGLLERNDVVYALNPPPEGGEAAFDWVKPGASGWDWWCDRDRVAVYPTTEVALEQVDFAAEMGWPYYTIDGGWYGIPARDDPERPAPPVRLEPRDGFDLHRVIAHAKEKGVGIWLWFWWDVVDNAANGLEATFAKFEKWGVKGVKLDFMERGDQEMVNWYERVVRCAAKHRLMVNFHAAYHPTGMDRTWPNQVTREGICGNEANKFYGWITPAHTATLPYTRFLVGPGDYTPGSFGNVFSRDFVPMKARGPEPGAVGTRVFPHEVGTRAHALALCVAYDSPIMTVCDFPENYRGQPGLEALRALPTTWNRTIPLPDGKIGENYSVLREAHDGTWYFAAFTVKARTARLPFAAMGEGDYEATVYADDPERTPSDATALRVFTTRLSHRETLELPLCDEGGCVARIRRLPR